LSLSEEYTVKTYPPLEIHENLAEHSKEYIEKLIDTITLYGSIASLLNDLGYDNTEVLERYYDTLHLLGSRIQGKYIENIAYYSSLKEKDSTSIIKLYGEAYMKSLLSYIASGTCTMQKPSSILNDIADTILLNHEAKKTIDNILIILMFIWK
jgi:hypothetical protein